MWHLWLLVPHILREAYQKGNVNIKCLCYFFQALMKNMRTQDQRKNNSQISSIQKNERVSQSQSFLSFLHPPLSHGVFISDSQQTEKGLHGGRQIIYYSSRVFLLLRYISHFLQSKQVWIPNYLTGKKSVPGSKRYLFIYLC